MWGIDPYHLVGGAFLIAGLAPIVFGFVCAFVQES